MPDLTDLPVELIDEIFYFAFTSKDVYNEDLVDINGLSRLLLVNRKHHQVFLPRVYSSWTYNGTRHSYSSLWKFLRTVVTNPDLAATVQVLAIGNWGACPPFYIERNRELQDGDEQFQFTSHDKEVVRSAIQHAGLSSELGSLFMDAIFTKCNGYRDKRPLIALTLTNLPNLSTVYACVPGRLSSFKELHLFGEVPAFSEEGPDIDKEDIKQPPLRLNEIWPVFYLHGLRTLYLYNFDPDGFGSLFEEKIKDTLKSLTFSWDKDRSKTKEKINGKKRTISHISNREVWTAIQKYKDTLEYLDVLHEFRPGSRTAKYRFSDHFGPLSHFTKLRYLSILTEMLIGGYAETPTTVQLKDTLPASIESLVLPTQECPKTTPSIAIQLEEVASQLPRCFRNRIRFGMQGRLCNSRIVRDHCPFPLGARCKSKNRWRKEYNMRGDGASRYAMAGTRAVRKREGRRETPSPPPPQFAGYSLITHVVPFQDHAGTPSFMVFQSHEEHPLPPLMNFNFYFTHPEGPLPDSEELGINLISMHDHILPQGPEPFHFRLDVYFLPGASTQDCMVHYGAEKATRDASAPPPTTPRMPGMVDVYSPMAGEYHPGLLFVHPGRSWGEEWQRICRIYFTPGQLDSFHEKWYEVEEVEEHRQSLGMEMWEHSWRSDHPDNVHARATRRGWTTW
ncbi:hypothetical protein ASPVEDRAFT_137144 [Aspergillus versicolor CBS 583.65]|uniref:Uncharacterized protein n=1 Tax=Aspergillus versicolor CBS 583.65 TaxID=1036611 RepID=A0A1L9PTX2_ASPVE|nr:uncharacterized protein ASPVEDRAFT_137144 [Aspergillus versicolor CBS 583.65]OJJ04876.1 hypothetical protein ASPVEDRAFT_137144 [Aspergillus versicolor CBS 583.65]